MDVGQSIQKLRVETYKHPIVFSSPGAEAYLLSSVVENRLKEETKW
jgi:hypothetical protein